MESVLETITERRVQKFFNPAEVNSIINSIDKIEVSMAFFAVKFFGGWL